MASQNDKIIFILGHGWSGTTLLNKVLTAHPQIYFINWEFNEFGVFYRRQSRYRKYGTRKYEIMTKDFFQHPKIRQNDFNYSSIDWSNIKNFQDWFNLIFNYYRQKTNKPIIGVKVANNLQKVKNTIANINLIKMMFSDTYCFQIVRDPRDIFLSFRKIRVLPWFLSPYYFGKFWVKAITTIRSLNKSVKYYEVRYEDLISQPQREIEKICQFIEVDFSPEMLKFYQKVDQTRPNQCNLKKNFIATNFNKWKSQLSPKVAKLISTVSASEMTELGYLENNSNYQIRFWRKIWEAIKTYIFIVTNLLELGNQKKRFEYLLGLAGLKLKKYLPPLYWLLKDRK